MEDIVGMDAWTRKERVPNWDFMNHVSCINYKEDEKQRKRNGMEEMENREQNTGGGGGKMCFQIK